MYGLLIVATIPASLAAGLGSPGLGLMAGASVCWAAALYVCSVAPVISGSTSSLNERLSTGLSMLAGSLACLGVLALTAGMFT